MCSVDSFVFLRTKVTNLHLTSGVCFFIPAAIRSSMPAHPEVILSNTFPQMCHHHSCFHLVLLSGFSFTIRVRSEYHHLVLLTYTLFQGIHHNIRFFHRKPTPWHVTYFLQFYKQKRQALSAPHCTFLYGSQPMSRFFRLYTGIYSVIAFVSHPFVFSIVCRVHNESSLAEDQGPTRKVETTEPYVGHQNGPIYKQFTRETADVRYAINKCESSSWQSFNVIGAECALPMQYVTRFRHRCSQLWIQCLGVPLVNPFKTNWSVPH